MPKYKRRNRINKVCAYCGRRADRTVTEHVFRRSWYPRGYPPHQMLTVPSCPDCNDLYERIEARIGSALILSQELDGTVYAGDVRARVMRSVNAHAAKKRREQRHREAKRQRMVRALRVANPRTLGNAIGKAPAPRWLHAPDGLWKRGVPTLQFDPGDAEALAIKFMRGCHFARTGEPLPVDAVCDARFANSFPVPAAVQTPSFGALPPFQCAVDVTPWRTLWLFRLWERFVFTAWWSPAIFRYWPDLADNDRGARA